MRIKIICGILALLMISAGVVVAVDNDTPPVIVLPPDSELDSTLMERPSTGDPSTIDPKECLYIAAGELQRSGGFKSTSNGASTSMGVSQGVASERTVVGNNSFKQSTSFSSLVKFGEQLYCWGENYLSRSATKVSGLNSASWADTAKKFDKEGWLNKIGYRNTGLTGYILNDKTIVDAKLEGFENGIYTFRYKLDVKVAPYYVLYEMRNNSGSKGFSEFSKAEIVVTMDGNFQVKTLSTDCEYKVPLMGGVNCKESLTETFFDIGYQGDLPEKEFFEGFFDADISTDEPTDPTALDVLMDMFAPYISGGEKLNASIGVAKGEQQLVSALISANIDIENTDNIAADVKIGNGLYLSYQDKKLFVTYQDFKGSTTVDGVMEFVNGLLTTLGVNGGGISLDAEALLSGMTFKIENDVCTVNLPLELGELKVDVTLFATVENDSYRFAKATAQIGDILLRVEPVAAWSIPERNGEYPEILGLTEIFNNGKIALNATIGNISANVMFDIATTTLHAKLGDIYATLQNNTLYATVGGAKIKLDIDDIDALTEILKPFVNTDGFSLPSVSIDDILAAVGSITATSTESGVVLSAMLDSLGLKLDVSLLSKENNWNLQSIVVKLGEVDVTVSPTQQFEVPAIGNTNEFVDVTDVAEVFVPTIASLLNAKGYGADFDLGIAVANKNYSVSGSLLFDANKNIEANATVFESTTAILQANIVYANDTVFLTANGIKVAFSTANLQTGSLDVNAIAQKLNLNSRLLNELLAKVNEVVEAVKSFNIANIEIASLVESLTYQNNTLKLVANGSVLALDKIDLELSATSNALTAKLNNFQFASVTLNLNATVGATEQTVAVPSTEDYVLNLTTEIAGIGVALSADLYNMDIAAKITLGNDTVDVRFVNNAIFAKLGNVAVKLTVEDVTKLIAKLGLNASTGNLDVANLLAGVKLDLASETPSISLATEQFAVALNFVRNNNISFNNITAAIGKQTVVVEQTESRVAPLDVSGNFLEAAPLLDEILSLVNTFKNAKGIRANVDAEITVNGKQYNAAITLRYNKGVHVAATVCDKTRTLAVIDCYFVKDTIYLDINGLRAAAKIDTLKGLAAKLGMNIEAQDNKDLAKILQSAKGISPVVDSVLNALENILANYKNIVVANVLESVSVNNGIWTVALDGSTLGLSKFTVALDGNTPSVAVADLTVGDVAINNLSASVAVNNAEVVAPTIDYTTELKVDVANIATAYLKLDLLNLSVFGKVEIWDTTVDLLLKDGTVYLVCGQARLNLALEQIDELVAEIGKFTRQSNGVSLKVSAADVLNSLTKSDTETGYRLGLTIDSIGIALDFDNATLNTAKVALGNTEITASLASSLTFNTVDTNAQFVNAVTLLQAYSDSIVELINASGYKVTANGNIAIGSKTVGLDASIVYNKGAQSEMGDIYAKAMLSYNSVNVVNAEIWLIDNTLYAAVDGLRLAIKLPASAKATVNKTLEETLAPVYGYNTHLDAVLDLAKDVVAQISGGSLNANAMIDGLALYLNQSNASATLTACLNGTQFGGISQFNITLAKNGNGLSASVEDLHFDDCALNVDATVAANTTAVALPANTDWTTNILVQLDDNNTLFANLDLLNGIYKFKLGEMNVMYSNNTFKVNKGNDIKILGNINVITEIVKRIDDIVKQFGGANESVTLPSDGKKLLAIDLKEILKTVEITTNANSVKVSLTAMKLPISLNITGGEEPQIDGIEIKIDLLKKTFVAKPNFDNTVVFDNFEDTADYIAIDEVLNDYMEPIDVLIHTNSWRFDFNADSQIVVKGTDNISTIYVLAQGSFVEFYYNTACKDKFTLRARIDVKKVADGKYNDFVLLDAVYQDGRIYLTYNNTLKATVSVDSIKECASLLDDLKRVIPQIDQLITKLMSAKDEAEGNVAEIDYSTIIRSVSYNEGKFSITLNAGVILSDLGDIVITASKTESTMTLECLQLSYGENNPHSSTINVVLQGVTVSASQLVKAPTGELDRDRYANVADINNYFNENGSIDKHMNFDSLKQLLSAVVNTADDTTFSIDGTAVADLSLIGIIKEKVTMGLSARVDIVRNDSATASNEDTVFFTVKLSRPKQSAVSLVNAAFDDYGGDSYLYFNGATNTITIIRNSYKLGFFSIDMKERDYEAEISVEEFSKNAVTYILKMVNFSGWVNDLITKPSDEQPAPYGLEDVFKWYSYSEEAKQFSLDLDLKPINSNLGAVNLNILHKVDTANVTKQTEEEIVSETKDICTLTNVNGTMKLLKDMMTLTLNLNLDQAPVSGDATYFVKNTVFWNTTDHAPKRA